VNFHFSKHYTIDEARALLPQVRKWLDQIAAVKEQLAKMDLRVASLSESGDDIGGVSVNTSMKLRADLHSTLREFADRGILVKDIDRGLIDFPSLKNGKEIFLCWEKDEEDIQFWHDLDSGFPGRERLD
jgi:hypothetical protein